MKKNRLLLICILLNSLSIQQIKAGEIALTFDDAPLAGSALMSGEEKTDRIIKQLKKHKVPDALFFVTTSNFQDNAKARLNRYTDAGFHLANHSHSHISANKISANDYLKDFYQSHLILNDFKNVLKFHRFPFLHYGDTPLKRSKINAGLNELSYQIGYTTVDNYEWYINARATQAADNNIDINFTQLRELYINTLWNSITFYDNIAKTHLGRSPKHVLLLHENEMAALFLGDLIEFLRNKGWEIISPQAAYNDPIAKEFSPLDLHFNNQGRVAAIAHSKGANNKELHHPSEDTKFLDAEFIRLRVFKN